MSADPLLASPSVPAYLVAALCSANSFQCRQVRNYNRCPSKRYEAPALEIAKCAAHRFSRGANTLGHLFSRQRDVHLDAFVCATAIVRPTHKQTGHLLWRRCRESNDAKLFARFVVLQA